MGAGFVLYCEGANHGGAAGVGIIDFAGGGGEGIDIVGIVAIEAGDAVKMVGKVHEQPGSSRQVGMSDTGWFHLVVGRVDGPRVTDESGGNKVAGNS
jgi:hypothetical protein